MNALGEVRKSDVTKNLSWALTGLIWVAGGLVLQARLSTPPLVDVFTPEHVSYFTMFDSSWQRLAHRVLLALVAIAAISVSSSTSRWCERFLPLEDPFGYFDEHVRSFGSAYVAMLFLAYVISSPALTNLGAAFYGAVRLG